SEVNMPKSTLLTCLLACSSPMLAGLIPVGVVATSGTGLGSLNAVLTMSSQGATTTESGCVAAGVGGVTITGPAACPPGFSGGDEQGLKGVFQASALGLTDFNNLQIVFSPSEPGSNSITVDNLALTLWDPVTGLILDAKYVVAPFFVANSDPGAGNAG